MSSSMEIESSMFVNDDSGVRTSRQQENGLRERHSLHEGRSEPPGAKLIEAFYRPNNVQSKRTFYKFLVLFITYMAYSCYHMGRRPLSIVKNVLNRNCSNLHEVSYDSQIGMLIFQDYDTNPADNSTWCDWAPFNNDATANKLLAVLDSAFLFSYAAFMFFSGFFADRCNLRYYLSFGMITSGILLYAFGLTYYLKIHSMIYFLIVQILSGALQTTGWPAVVTCVGNWFDASSRGLVFGIWNSHTNIGNILGAMISGYFVQKSWGLSFMVPGLIMLINGVIVFIFLVPKPGDVGLPPEKAESHQIDARGECTEVITDCPERTTRRKPHRVPSFEDSALSETDNSQTLGCESSPLIDSGSVDVRYEPSEAGNAASFQACLKIPGVLEYSMCLFFSKLVSYTFLYWLPRFITQSTVNNSEDSAYLSTPFDVGGIFGAILAGYLTDKYKTSGIICTVMLCLAIPSMFIYEKFASISNLYNICLQLVAGSLVNGPYALITTAVSTDLSARVKSGKAMATVAAIIDGTGSIGAAVGPLFAGFVSDSGWQSVFIMLMISDLLASLCLLRITIKEIRESLGFLSHVSNESED